MNVYEAADNYNADGQEVSGTIHLPAAARVGGPGVGEEQWRGWWCLLVIPYCATAPPTGAPAYCTLRSSWLCPCWCSARCL